MNNKIISIDDKRGTVRKNTAKSRLYNWKKRGILSHIRKGVYLPPEVTNKFQIACFAVPDGCLSYHSALEYYGLQTQEFNWLYVHSSTPFRTFTHNNQSYLYKPLKFILKPHIDTSNPDYPITVTSINQTIIDCLYNIGLAGGLEELLYSLSEIAKIDVNESELLKCLALYKNKSLYQRAGFVLSHFRNSLGLSNSFFSECQHKSGNNVSYLTDSFYSDTYNKEWRICAPGNILSEISKGIYYEQV